MKTLRKKKKRQVLRSPIVWFGGKGGYCKNKILPFLNVIEHKKYLEPFGGGASLLIAKKIVSLEIYNDLDKELYDLFTVLSDEKDFKDFYRRIAVLPQSREIYNQYIKDWRNEVDKIKRVAMWYYIARFSFSGIFGNGLSIPGGSESSIREKALAISRWFSILEMLPDIHVRLQRVLIENQDYKILLDRYNQENTLIYCDPPYIKDTRRSGEYQHDFTSYDHYTLCKLLLESKAKIVLSGYQHGIYNVLEKNGFIRYDFQVACAAVGKTLYSGLIGNGACKENQYRTESLWISPNCIEEVRHLL